MHLKIEKIILTAVIISLAYFSASKAQSTPAPLDASKEVKFMFSYPFLTDTKWYKVWTPNLLKDKDYTTNGETDGSKWGYTEADFSGTGGRTLRIHPPINNDDSAYAASIDDMTLLSAGPPKAWSASLFKYQNTAVAANVEFQDYGGDYNLYNFEVTLDASHAALTPIESTNNHENNMSFYSFNLMSSTCASNSSSVPFTHGATRLMLAYSSWGDGKHFAWTFHRPEAVTSDSQLQKSWPDQTVEGGFPMWERYALLNDDFAALVSNPKIRVKIQIIPGSNAVDVYIKNGAIWTAVYHGSIGMRTGWNWDEYMFYPVITAKFGEHTGDRANIYFEASDLSYTSEYSFNYNNYNNTTPFNVCALRKNNNTYLPTECTRLCSDPSQCNDWGLNPALLTCEKSGACDSTCSECAVACSTNTECNDNNDLTVDTCDKLGTCDANCINTACIPACNSETDCGDSNAVTIDKCNNAGTCDAVCSNTPCSAACSNDAACNDGNPLTTDTCTNPDSCLAGCVHDACEPVCANDAACDDGNSATKDICNNANTCLASCKHTEIDACNCGPNTKGFTPAHIYESPDQELTFDFSIDANCPKLHLTLDSNPPSCLFIQFQEPGGGWSAPIKNTSATKDGDVATYTFLIGDAFKGKTAQKIKYLLPDDNLKCDGL